MCNEPQAIRREQSGGRPRPSCLSEFGGRSCCPTQAQGHGFAFCSGQHMGAHTSYWGGLPGMHVKEEFATAGRTRNQEDFSLSSPMESQQVSRERQ